MWHLAARDLVCCFFGLKPASRALRLNRAYLEPCFLSHDLEDNLPITERKRSNLPAIVERETILEVCYYGIPQKWLSTARLPTSSSYSVKSLTSYFLRCKVFCLVNSEGTALLGVQLVVEDVMANSGQLLDISLAMQPHL